MVQPCFPISLPVFLLALALAHDIVVLLGYHFDSALLIFTSFLHAQSTGDDAGSNRLKASVKISAKRELLP